MCLEEKKLRERCLRGLMKKYFACFCLMLFVASAWSQEPYPIPPASTPQSGQDQPNQQVEPMDKMPLFHVNVVARSTKAVNYRHRGGSTTVDLRGTTRMPEAGGRAKVDGKAGRLAINAEVTKL